MIKVYIADGTISIGIQKIPAAYSSLPKLDARELRHSYASMLLAAGGERKLIGTSMGHTNFDTTDGYIDVEQARMSDVRNAGIGYVLAH